MIPQHVVQQIRRLEIRTRGLVSELFEGAYASAFKGRGVEFSEVRPYQYGDDVRSIDWNVSARMGETYVKLFEEEREQRLMLAVDVSGSQAFGSRRRFKRDLAAELCAVLGFSAIENNDKVGLLLYSDEVEHFIPPRKGRRHVLRLIRDLFVHEPRSKNTDLGMASTFLAGGLRRRSIVLLVSDFFDEGYERPLGALGRRHDVVAIQLVDPRDLELPDIGLVDLVDAETGTAAVVDTGSRRVRQEYAARAARRQQAIADTLRRTRVDHVRARTDAGYVEPLIRYFRQRNRRR